MKESCRFSGHILKGKGVLSFIFSSALCCHHSTTSGIFMPLFTLCVLSECPPHLFYLGTLKVTSVGRLSLSPKCDLRLYCHTDSNSPTALSQQVVILTGLLTCLTSRADREPLRDRDHMLLTQWSQCPEQG